jgi:hypothetical protein
MATNLFLLIALAKVMCENNLCFGSKACEKRVTKLNVFETG